MIDVVFVIMLFFMAMAAALRHERHLNLKLPGITYESGVSMPPLEISIGISEAGEISLNDEIVSNATDHRLQALASPLCRLAQHSQGLHSPALITIDTEPHANFQRIIEVLDAVKAAGLSNVTFTVAEDSI